MAQFERHRRDDDDKIDDTEEITGDCGEGWLYSRLTKKKYKKHPYEQRDLGENMTLVNQEIYGYIVMRMALA